MKKLGKLEINSERIMKNEELLVLRGGYESINFYCVCGHCGDFAGECNPIFASGIENALQFYNQYCGGLGCTCRDDGCPQWYC
jgi:hypothetical protein